MILFIAELENPWPLPVAPHWNVGATGSRMESVLTPAGVLALSTVPETEGLLTQCSMDELKNIYHLYVQRIEDDSNVTMT